MSVRRIILLFVCLFLYVSFAASAQGAVNTGTSKYSVQIDLKQAYIGGLCIIKGDESALTASVVNEFGVSMLTFSYDVNKGKVKIINCIKQLRNPFIKRILKKDFKEVLDIYLTQNETHKLPIKHINQKHDITYNLIPF